MPRVSIVVRTKDRPEFLRRALVDIAAQTFDDWEAIVVNDGGDAAAVAAVMELASVDCPFTMIDSPAPGGRCAAANAGINAAAGEYVVLHDDDDRWDPSFLARTTNWLDTNPADGGVMVSTAIVYEEQRGDEWVEVERVPYWAGMSRLSVIELLEINRAVPISFLYRRSLHDLAGLYDESLEAVEDWDFYLRAISVAPIGFISGEPLAFWAQRPRAAGAAANSMFALGEQHIRDDLRVRDRALAAWIDTNGPGLPLYIALMERRIKEHTQAQLMELRRDLTRELDARHPIWSRIRRLWRQRRGR